jgi:hypothetical protein
MKVSGLSISKRRHMKKLALLHQSIYKIENLLRYGKDIRTSLICMLLSLISLYFRLYTCANEGGCWSLLSWASRSNGRVMRVNARFNDER